MWEEGDILGRKKNEGGITYTPGDYHDHQILVGQCHILLLG